jgi:hypothetical protein
MRAGLDTNALAVPRTGSSAHGGTAGSSWYSPRAKRRWMIRDDVAALIRTLAQAAVLVDGTTDVSVCRDRDDDKFLAAAGSARQAPGRISRSNARSDAPSGHLIIVLVQI